jgi:glutamyl/glutaminyl-tRNA synthetase
MEPDGDVVRQTSRLARHLEVLEELKRRGVLYPCFCSGPAGAEQSSAHSCRHLSGGEANARIETGEPHCWRFKVHRGHDFIYVDKLRGSISVSTDSMEDFAVSRSDGSVKYLLAAVVDDHDTGVSHVIRGEEHLSNVPKQEMIYSSLDWNSPEWAHIPMVLDLNRHKLSKRLGAVSIGEYRSRGWEPEAIVSYLATLSWSGAPSDRIMPIGELAAAFDLDAVAKFSPLHDEERMAHFGKIRMSDAPDESLLDHCEHIFALHVAYDDKIALIREVKPQCATYSELINGVQNELSLGAVDSNETLPDWFAGLSDVLADIAVTDWRADYITDAMKSFARGCSLNGREFFHPVRIFLTGASRGAPIGLILSCVGKEKILTRLELVIAHRVEGENFE